MGSCASRSSSATPVELTTAKVVDMDGSMAQFAVPVTAHEAVAAITGRATSSSRFLCCSDELFFDAPVRPLAARDALRAGQIYFALPLAMLHRPFSGQDMAALAAKASAALGAAPVAAAVDDADDGRVSAGVVSTSSKGKNGDGDVAGKRHRRRQQKGRVAPIVVVSGDGRSAQADGELKKGCHVTVEMVTREQAAVYGDRTVGKTRNGAGYTGGTRRRSAVPRLSVIAEAATDE